MAQENNAAVSETTTAAPRGHPVSGRIADLRDWLRLPPELRADSKGALAVLDEIAASHAELLAACEMTLARLRRQGPTTDAAEVIVRRIMKNAVARAEGRKP